MEIVRAGVVRVTAAASPSPSAEDSSDDNATKPLPASKQKKAQEKTEAKAEAKAQKKTQKMTQKKAEEKAEAKLSDTPSTNEASTGGESFEALFEESFGSEKNIVGSVLAGTVVALEGDYAVIDVGLKTEGRVPIKEFISVKGQVAPKPGDVVEVFIERLEDRNGKIQISREKVQREEAWQRLEEQFQNETQVKGTIKDAVKGGFTVDLDGAEAFLPGSLVDIRPLRDHSELLQKEIEFQILKMDRARNNIVVSRRAILEKERAGQREKLIETIQEGRVMEGIVKNVTDYGAFIDLGGIDGLLHVTDMSWKRINHPRDVVEVGESLTVQIIRYNAETQRVSLGIKQMEKNPWDEVGEKFPAEAKAKGRVTRVTDYGAFVELEPGIEGLVHVSEMSWMRKNVHPSKMVSVSEEVEVQVLGLDLEKKRISLGMKSCQPNPWTTFAEQHKVGDEIEGTVKNTAEFGLFLTLPMEADGMVHITDLVWSGSPDEALKKYKRGDKVKVKILEINVKKERVSLGIKQLDPDPFAESVASLKEGEVVTCSVVKVQEGGILVEVAGAAGEKIEAFIRRGDLARNRAEQRPDRYAAGEKVDAQVMDIDNKQRKLTLSVKAREVAEVKEVTSTYGSADSGAVLGDILGKALEEKEARDGGKKAKKTASKEKPKKSKKEKVETKTTPKEKVEKVEEETTQEAAQEEEQKDAMESASVTDEELENAKEAAGEDKVENEADASAEEEEKN